MTAIKRLINHLLENEDDDDAFASDAAHLDLNKKELPQIIVIGYSLEQGDFKVQCPVCKFVGFLMSDFSLLSSGFGGVQPGDVDDVDGQECGHCGAVLNWDNVPADPSEDQMI